MDKARIYVDFNELVDDNIVLLSKSDTKIDSKGNIVTFYEGMPISVYSDDIDENGEIDNLIAEGIARKQNLGGNWQEMWCCHMEPNSIMHESDKIKKARIYWFSEEEGGRKELPKKGQYYYPTIELADESTWSLVIKVDKLNQVKGERVTNGKVHFLFDHAPHNILRSSAEFILCEGPHKVAAMVIL
ncbi:MAG: hypothetical protein IKM28_04815 [Lachnospiraceae bacterium]|nr:hypothetical protein [Lachnospiraceae bacterium]